jgi:catechol-2,3-dioxygenase
MSRNPFSHIDLRVRDLGEATEFYREFLPAISFTQWWGEEEWRGGSASRSFTEKNEKMYEK